MAKVAQDLAAASAGVRSKVVVLQENGGSANPDVDCEVVGSSVFLVQLYRTAQIVRRFRPDVIHVHSFVPLALATLIARRQARLVRTVHNQYPHFQGSSIRSRLKRRAEGKLHRLGDATLVCVSPAVRNSLPWLSGEALVIENGIDFDRLARLAKERVDRPPSSKDAITIVGAGRLESQKNFSFLLHSFALCAKGGSRPLRLRILGAGSEFPQLQKLADDLGISQWVEFLGHQANPFPYLASADVYASTSRYEGLSLALIEALGLRLPAVVTRSGGVAASLESGRELIVVEDYRPEAFAAALTQLIESPVMRRELAESGMRAAHARYALDRMLSSYSNLYRALTDE